MEEATGTIRVMKNLDRELNPKHTLVITILVKMAYYMALLIIFA